MIRHILFMTFNKDVSHEQINRVSETFLQVPEKVEGVISVEWGVNDSPEAKNAGYTHCVLMTFQDEDARQRYLPHPAHDALKSILEPLLQEIIVLDFRCDG